MSELVSRHVQAVRMVNSRWLAAVVIVVCFGWSFWPTLRRLWLVWQTAADYSAGQLVPLAAVYLLWRRRHDLTGLDVRPCWWGLAVLALSQAARFLGAYWVSASLERCSLVLAVAGLVLLLAGSQVFWQLRWLLLFLVLALPLPARVHELVSLPMQTMATRGAGFLLELAGLAVIQEGNVLHLDGRTSIAVAEACNGLRMLTAFVIVAAVMAMLVTRPAWQRAGLLISSVPVAIAANVLRLAVTGMVAMALGSTLTERFHDLAGLLMMPLAVAILAAELALFARLVSGGQLQSARRQAAGPR
ncbi:MAG: exosortase/archaeosortase family protein [Phycisphaerae bacterium]